MADWDVDDEWDKLIERIDAEYEADWQDALTRDPLGAGADLAEIAFMWNMELLMLRRERDEYRASKRGSAS